ncbi:MAG: hypothetical protein HOA61_01920 [Bacteroidetes bacterium]|jgi:hypothetical protein|nr:hypothetical protein [Chloroflexota bacterium]MBT6834777.1 hypothetical protein [Bacteroidota bacterium]MBT4002500.1 hypothetical protein [Chloroflexota bacterium]MBT4306213.1 hypothetical protein [Chloroflexota bacterium]MBT4534998.1 hypothetical protein [Chloroflexota bacterium]
MSDNNLKYIFCINSGRVGSEYLAKLLDSAENCIGFHEPKPKMIGVYTKLVKHFPYSWSKPIRVLKINKIKKRFSVLRMNENVYAETTNMFIKTFSDVAGENFKNINVIFLKRKLIFVLKSFVDLGYFLPERKEAKKWFTSSNSITSAIKAIKKDYEMDQIELIISYLIDIEARGNRFKLLYPEIPVFEVNIEQLNKIHFVKSLFSKLDLNYSNKTGFLIGDKINFRNKKKLLNTELDYLQNRIDEYLKKAEEMGIKIPSSLYL